MSSWRLWFRLGVTGCQKQVLTQQELPPNDRHGIPIKMRKFTQRSPLAGYTLNPRIPKPYTRRLELSNASG